MNLQTPIANLSGVGPFVAKKLTRLGIKTLEDLLYHFPFRYEDFSKITPIDKITLNCNVCVKGKILEIKGTRTWQKKMHLTTAVIEDKTGAIKVVWFNQPFLLKTIQSGQELYLAGKARMNKDGVFLSNPVYEIADEINPTKHTARLVPVYEETIGLTSRWFRNFFAKNLPFLSEHLVEFLPSQIIQQYNLLPFKEALWQIHFPQSLQMAQKAQNRFAFEELLITELFVLKERLKINQQKAPVIDLKLEEIKKFVQSLPFRLTDSQKKCAWQILKDMQKPHPMNRLLEGDVGSGKTVVALIAILNCIKNGYQVALMAPTEILVNQHFKTAAVLLKKFKVRIALLTGKKDLLISQKISYEKDGKMLLETIEISRSKILEKTKKGEIDLLVGTHTLIQDKVKFQNLGLVIVDEQHRFGVQQRAKLNQKSDILAHFLSMTATPIPRTLALTVYGDLDLSVLDQMPSGRKPVITKIIPPQKREEAYQFITKQIEQGNQAFVICPRIEPNSPENTESLLERKNIWAEVKAVKAEYEKLAQEVFPRFKVAMMHGKMKANEKEKIMRQFQNGKIDILVSTSVVEVGIDIPKATVMIIEDADRFGLAQIHQFRGRVGRSDLQSYCFLFTNSAGKKTRERLSALLQAKNGFELAQKDLEIRGPGSLLGAKQWGLPDLAMSYLNNLQLIETVREAAKNLLTNDPYLRDFALLNKKINNLGQKIHLE